MKIKVTKPDGTVIEYEFDEAASYAKPLGCTCPNGPYWSTIRPYCLLHPPNTFTFTSNTTQVL